ncbi:MAG TPA: MBL fold metallo-hydrolase, partial [Bdellovibrionales bacterium]|nr:MBL fold metallo-hydrolase [Bdellovibrionales bacterium]
MKRFVFNNATKIKLSLGGKPVSLKLEELAALKACLPRPAGLGASDETWLKPRLQRRLFERGFLLPDFAFAHQEAENWKARVEGKTLAPELTIEARMNTARDGFEPAIAMFLPEGLMRAAGELSAVLTQALGPVLHQTAIARRNLPKAKALRLADETARRWLESHPDAAAWFSWNRSGKSPLRLRANSSVRAARRPAAGSMTLALGLRGRETTFDIPVSSLPAVHRILSGLNGAAGAFEDFALLDVSGRALLQALDGLGALIPRTPRAPARKTQALGPAFRITSMGHAFLIVDCGATRVLIDPWLIPHDARNEVQPIRPCELGKVDAIFFTHHHPDHMDTATLLQLPHDVPVYVPKHAGGLTAPRYKMYLKALGFLTVRELAHDESVLAGEGLRITALPFYGEARRLLDFGANCYLLSHEGNNALIHADAGRDNWNRSLMSDGYLRKLAKKFGNIEVIFGTWWQHRVQVLDLAPQILLSSSVGSAEWLNLTEFCNCTPAFVEKFVRAAGAKMFVTYAERGHECFRSK